MLVMPAFSNRKVMSVLRRLGFSPRPGNGSGHACWANAHGHRCRPRLRHKDVPFEALYCLGGEIERSGTCSRQAFLSLVKN